MVILTLVFNVIKKLFVYGTLRPGGRYNYLTEGLSLLSASPAYIDGFDLYLLRPQNYPGIVPGVGRVYGDLLEFADISSALLIFDDLEGVDNSPPYYFREKVTVNPLGQQAWVYILNNDDFPETTQLFKLKSGDWHKRK